MSLDKAIEHGREKRKPYYKLCYQIDRTCRNHGGNGKKHDGWQCLWCKENRLYQSTKEKMRTDKEVGEVAYDVGDILPSGQRLVRRTDRGRREGKVHRQSRQCRVVQQH